MHKAIRFIAVAGLSLPLLLAAQSASNVTLPQDKGPAKIDVSSYPADQQKGYKVFADKCSKCHTIARPINTTMTQPEWERYVKRMMHKPNSGISDSQGKDDLRVPCLRPGEPQRQESVGVLQVPERRRD